MEPKCIWMGKASMQAGGITNSNEWEDAIEPYTVQRKRCTLVKKCFISNIKFCVNSR